MGCCRNSYCVKKLSRKDGALQWKRDLGSDVLSMKYNASKDKTSFLIKKFVGNGGAVRNVVEIDGGTKGKGFIRKDDPYGDHYVAGSTLDEIKQRAHELGDELQALPLGYVRLGGGGYDRYDITNKYDMVALDRFGNSARRHNSYISSNFNQLDLLECIGDSWYILNRSSIFTRTPYLFKYTNGVLDWYLTTTHDFYWHSTTMFFGSMLYRRSSIFSGKPIFIGKLDRVYKAQIHQFPDDDHNFIFKFGQIILTDDEAENGWKREFTISLQSLGSASITIGTLDDSLQLVDLYVKVKYTESGTYLSRKTGLRTFTDDKDDENNPIPENFYDITNDIKVTYEDGYIYVEFIGNLEGKQEPIPIIASTISVPTPDGVVDLDETTKFTAFTLVRENGELEHVELDLEDILPTDFFEEAEGNLAVSLYQMYVTNEHIYLVTSIDNKIRVLKINDQFEIVGSISGDIDYYFNEWPKTSSISISPKSFNQFVVDKEENIIFVAPSSGPQVHIPPSKHPDLPLNQAGNWLTEGENFGHYDFDVYADLIEWDLHDKWFDTVIKFDGDGNFLWSRRTHSNPIGVEVDEDCNIYIYGDTEDQDIIGGFSMFDFGETNIISHANMFTFYTRLGHEYKEDGFYKFFVEESVYNIPEGRVFGRSFTPAEGENYITLEGNGIAEIEVPWDCTADQMAQILNSTGIFVGSWYATGGPLPKRPIICYKKDFDRPAIYSGSFGWWIHYWYGRACTGVHTTITFPTGGNEIILDGLLFPGSGPPFFPSFPGNSAAGFPVVVINGMYFVADLSFSVGDNKNIINVGPGYQAGTIGYLEGSWNECMTEITDSLGGTITENGGNPVYEGDYHYESDTGILWFTTDGLSYTAYTKRHLSGLKPNAGQGPVTISLQFGGSIGGEYVLVDDDPEFWALQLYQKEIINAPNVVPDGPTPDYAALIPIVDGIRFLGYVPVSSFKTAISGIRYEDAPIFPLMFEADETVNADEKDHEITYIYNIISLDGDANPRWKYLYEENDGFVQVYDFDNDFNVIATWYIAIPTSIVLAEYIGKSIIVCSGRESESIIRIPEQVPPDRHDTFEWQLAANAAASSRNGNLLRAGDKILEEVQIDTQTVEIFGHDINDMSGPAIETMEVEKGGTLIIVQTSPEC